MKGIYTCLLSVCFIAAHARITHNDTTLNHIHEERFVNINGIEQWITIKGDTTKPIVLFLHGGPGSPLSPYADAIYKHWEQNFLLVQWDQRGAGRTFGRNAPTELTPEYLRSNPLTLEQMTADGITLAKYLLKLRSKQKLILFGSSWGTVLGVKMAQKSPELFYSYIGHSQVVDPSASNLSAYNHLAQQARKLKDTATLDRLRLLGKPPYDTARSAGQLMRLIKKYQQKRATPPPSVWFDLPAKYDSEKENQHRADGDDYSFANYTGDKKLGIVSIASTVNFFKDGLAFQIPVFIIQGEEDIQTPSAITSVWFKKIEAPFKKIFLLPETEHGFNASVIDTHYKIMTDYIVPKIIHSITNR